MLTLTHIYFITGVVLAIVAYYAAIDTGNKKRWGTSAFWGLLAVTFVAGDYLPAEVAGIIVIALALIAGFGGIGRSSQAEVAVEQRKVFAANFGHKLFGPALAIPILTLAGALGFQFLSINGQPLVETSKATLISLGLACVIAFAFAVVLTRRGPMMAINDSRRILDSIGWAALLPILLATLGGVFAQAGVGDVIAKIVTSAIPVDNSFAVVCAYALGMALFTIIMGNAFAAFPVITAGIGLPLLVGLHGANPAAMAAIGMLSGYCGTLMTPMAANFNIVPVALLELPDQYAVIRAQAPTGALLLMANIGLMYWLIFL